MAGDIFSNIIAGLIVAAIGVVLGRFSRLLLLMADGLFTQDLPNISGTFKSTYKERDVPTAAHPTPDVVETTETIRAHRIGRFVYGEIHSERWGTDYTFVARITRDVITGQFKPKTPRRNPTGIGTFQLRAKKGDDQFDGHQNWVDHTTGDIENSDYTWIRLPS